MTKCKKLQLKKKGIFFYQNLQFTYPQAFIKDVQATEKVFIPQKRKTNTSELKISSLLWVIFALLGPDQDPHS
jgi:hypothetical protein